jgi:hypothetical protein
MKSLSRISGENVFTIITYQEYEHLLTAVARCHGKTDQWIDLTFSRPLKQVKRIYDKKKLSSRSTFVLKLTACDFDETFKH